MLLAQVAPVSTAESARKHDVQHGDITPKDNGFNQRQANP
jgi:hypothetical protein